MPIILHITEDVLLSGGIPSRVAWMVRYMYIVVYRNRMHGSDPMSLRNKVKWHFLDQCVLVPANKAARNISVCEKYYLDIFMSELRLSRTYCESNIVCRTLVAKHVNDMKCCISVLPIMSYHHYNIGCLKSLWV